MKRVVWSCGMLATIALLLFPPRAALAQGVTSAAVAGRITDESGTPVPAAQLALTNGSTGQRYAARSRDDGRYSFENVEDRKSTRLNSSHGYISYAVFC